MNKNTPAWVISDQAAGWPSRGGITASIHFTLLKGPIDKNDPNVYKISLVTLTGDEKESIWLPANTPVGDVMDEVEKSLESLNVPFKGIRVYRGTNKIHEEDFEMRG
jgi:hypothetical protein